MYEIFLKKTISRALADSFSGSFRASRTIVAHKLLYCRYDRPATRQYAEAAAVDDIVSK